MCWSRQCSTVFLNAHKVILFFVYAGCVIAGNISPIDVITHVPIICEEANIPYIYLLSKEDLATAGATKRPTCCVLVLTKPIKGELENEVKEKLQSDYEQVASDVVQLTSCSEKSESRVKRKQQASFAHLAFRDMSISAL